MAELTQYSRNSTTVALMQEVTTQTCPGPKYTPCGWLQGGHKADSAAKSSEAHPDPTAPSLHPSDWRMQIGRPGVKATLDSVS